MNLILLDLVYNVIVVVFAPIVCLINLLCGANIDLRDLIDKIYSNFLSIEGANIEGLRRLRMVSQFFFENFP